jgi:hypothetical protein
MKPITQPHRHSKGSPQHTYNLTWLPDTLQHADGLLCLALEVWRSTRRSQEASVLPASSSWCHAGDTAPCLPCTLLMSCHAGASVSL